MSIRLMKKEIPGSHYFLCTEQFTDTNLFTFLHTGKLTSSEHAKCAFIINYYILFPLCAHILYIDAAKFSIKLLTVSVVRQRDEYEKVIETRPIKTRLHNQFSLPRC